MRFKRELFEGSGTFARGVHPPEGKHFSAAAPIEVLPAAKKLVLPLQQNIGAPCKPVVKARQQVAAGETIAEGAGFVSAKLHAPFSGKVLKPAKVTLPNGRRIDALPIEADEGQIEGADLWEEIFGGDWPTQGIDEYDPSEISKAISEAGIVGLGGAAFPTHVKIMPNDKKPIHTVLINGCECEPYLTADYRLMVEAPGPIIAGALLAARSVGASRIFIGVEDNKPEAIERLKKAAEGTAVTIAVLKTKYPQGSEKQLIKAITRREVPLGGLPSDVGVAMSNVGTAAAIARAVVRGKPLTHRIVSVTGSGIATPKNLLVPVGISFGELIDFCGGLTEKAARLIAGGPMMGFAFTDRKTPVTKGTSGLTVLGVEEVEKAEETNCVRCGRCVDACPMNLVPTKIALAARHHDHSLALMYNITACFECGSCAYICPASLPLVQLIRTGKAEIASAIKK